MNHCTKQQLIAFEDRVKDLFEQGELPYLLHMSGGNEDALIELFWDVKPGDWIFSTHRSHYHYLLAGGNAEWLLDLIKRGKSMFIYDRNLNFCCSSILAGTCGIAAGVAQQLKEEGSTNHVWCFLGDGAEDEGHFYEAVMYVSGQDLPCTFVVENNNRSVDTSIVQRRGPNTGVCLTAPCIYRYSYTPVYPHAGTGCKQWVKFKPEAISRYLNENPNI